MEINDDEEMRSSPPPNIKRESEEMNKPISPIDPVEPDDAPTDMAVSRKRPRWARQILQMTRGMKPHMVLPEKIKDLRGSLVM